MLISQSSTPFLLHVKLDIMIQSIYLKNRYKCKDFLLRNDKVCNGWLKCQYNVI